MLWRGTQRVSSVCYYRGAREHLLFSLKVVDNIFYCVLCQLVGMCSPLCVCTYRYGTVTNDLLLAKLCQENINRTASHFADCYVLINTVAAAVYAKIAKCVCFLQVTKHSGTPVNIN